MRSSHKLTLIFALAFACLLGWAVRPTRTTRAAAPAVFASIVVNTTGDENGTGASCSLREAIIAANTNAAFGGCTAGTAGLDTITFNLGAGTPTIAPTFALPTITEPININGNTGGATRVELNGAAAGGVSGLVINAGGSTVEGLVINRFNQNGILLQTNGGNTVRNSYIGTDATGTIDLGNGVHGVVIRASSNNVIGGTTGTTPGGACTGNCNLISGNGVSGILIDGGGPSIVATNNQVLGNFIGTDVSGTLDLGNGSSGVLIYSASNNTIGGITANARNVISGNDGEGVDIASDSPTTGNKVQGNFIGVQTNGTTALPNLGSGVNIRGAVNTTVGGNDHSAGVCDKSCNLISGNGDNGNDHGVFVQEAASSGNQVLGNFIGTNLAGTAALPNRGAGVFFFGAPNNSIGGGDHTAGVCDKSCNLISGNRGDGVDLTLGVDRGADNTSIAGNFIGTNASGNSAVPNKFTGVFVGTNNNFIGGTARSANVCDQACNLISGNNGNGGVYIGSASGNQVLGNYIGTNVTGTAALGNSSDGVFIEGAPGNTIGGTTASAGNLISGNNLNGVNIRFTTGNKILGNAIFNNLRLGIDLGGLGVTANDAGDPDKGENNLQNFPVITAATATTISGTLDSLPANTAYPVRIEFFANTACDASGNGEGEVFVGATTIAAPGTFSGAYTLVPGKQNLTATATDNNGNTSEFSACFTGPNAVTSAPVVSITDPFGCTGPGDALTVTVAINNAAAFSQPVTFTATLPPGLVGLPGTGTSTVGAAPTVTATGATFGPTVLAAGQTATVTYQVQVGDVAPGTTLTIVTASTFSGVAGPGVNASAQINCLPVGPGALYPSTAEVSDQKAGSVLIYNYYTSSLAAAASNNTRISITNTNPGVPIAVHLFFVDGLTCSVADAFVCLTQNQTVSLLASDYDPGTNGYVVAVATDLATGCPVNFNFLIGDEFVKTDTGFQANLGAEAVAALAGGLPLCNDTVSTATLTFDGVSYNRLPRVLAADNLADNASGNSTQLVINRIDGNLATGASALGTLFGVLYDDIEQSYSFQIQGRTCQVRGIISSTFPRTVPRVEQVIPAGRSGWLKLYDGSSANAAILGAQLVNNASLAASANAFRGGHNLHKLTLAPTASITLPVFPPNCRL